MHTVADTLAMAAYMTVSGVEHGCQPSGRPRHLCETHMVQAHASQPQWPSPAAEQRRCAGLGLTKWACHSSTGGMQAYLSQYHASRRRAGTQCCQADYCTTPLSERKQADAIKHCSQHKRGTQCRHGTTNTGMLLNQREERHNRSMDEHAHPLLLHALLLLPTPVPRSALLSMQYIRVEGKGSSSRCACTSNSKQYHHTSY